MTLAMQGQDAMDSGDTTRAEELLNEALATNPDNLYAQASLSKLYMKQSRYDLAKPLCEKIVARETGDRQSAGTAEESPEAAGLVQEARENLELIRREESVDQELLALEPATASPSAAREPAATARPLVREEPTPVVALKGATAAPSTKAARYRIQVGAFRSPEGAQRLSRRLNERYAELLRDKEVLLAESNGFTRVQVGPYQTLSEASDACRTFSRGGLRCFPKSR
jgi:tetratricopeptide (TPR) repeat protein